MPHLCSLLHNSFISYFHFWEGFAWTNSLFCLLLKPFAFALSINLNYFQYPLKLRSIFEAHFPVFLHFFCAFLFLFSLFFIFQFFSVSTSFDEKSIGTSCWASLELHNHTKQEREKRKCESIKSHFVLFRESKTQFITLGTSVWGSKKRARGWRKKILEEKQ